ncbi:DUF3341 domain-containing protein [Myxococcus faecalis]|uniref:DUF3341 domain-containing protein n=1 Tax=Myxococcus faecalis TaxID=3115646 RepID=UPI003CE880D4
MAERAHAVVGYCRTPSELFLACAALRDGGYTRFDAHTPFPVHGLEKAMGVAQSRLPFIVLVMGLLGGGGGLALQWWTSAVDYPLVIGGKPFFALEFAVPVTFELTILLAAFGTFFGLWALCRLPRFFDPVMQHPEFGRATDDLFFICVETADPRFHPDQTRALLERHGVQDLKEVLP